MSKCVKSKKPPKYSNFLNGLLNSWLMKRKFSKSMKFKVAELLHNSTSSNKALGLITFDFLSFFIMCHTLLQNNIFLVPFFVKLSIFSLHTSYFILFIFQVYQYCFYDKFQILERNFRGGRRGNRRSRLSRCPCLGQ